MGETAPEGAGHVRNRARPPVLTGVLPSIWSVGAVLIAAIVLAPIASVILIALLPEENIWPHLSRTVLPRYLSTTFTLMFAVGLATAAVGSGCAWLVTRYRFPLVRWLEWLLLLPLSVPAFVGAYAMVDFLEYAGPVQTALREAFGWQSARDYWFPEIRSMGGAIIVLSAALYPYVYLLARAAFREQSGAVEEVARSLGAGPWRRFLTVGLPLARPAVAAGVAIVMMETVNDFGTIDFFAVQTLTAGVFEIWLEGGNRGGAAQIAAVMLALVVLLLLLEKVSRRKARFFAAGGGRRPVSPARLEGAGAWAATVFCALPVLVGFVLPVLVMGWHAFGRFGHWLEAELLDALTNSLVTGGLAAVTTVVAAVFMVYAVRLSGRRLPAALLPVTVIGYAVPGAVLAVGILIPLAAIDHRLADAVLALTGRDPGLILTGSSFAIVLAYFVRFFAIAQGAADAAMGRVSPNLGAAARSLGHSRGRTLSRVYFPLMRGSLFSAMLLVFVDALKELPATLLLRPFNYDTLATRVHEQASLENLPDAAPGAIVIIAVGLLAVLLLARASR